MTPSGADFLFPLFLTTVNCIHVAAVYSMKNVYWCRGRQKVGTQSMQWVYGMLKQMQL